MNRLFKCAALVSAATLAGCAGDPESQQPVQVRPGMYEAEMAAGFGPFSLSASDSARRSCVSADEAEFFPQVFTRKYLSMEGECDGPLSQRKGNLVTGEMTCPGEEGQNLTMQYAATVRPESVSVAVKGSITMTAEMLEQSSETAAKLSRAITMNVAIKRIGDC